MPLPVRVEKSAVETIVKFDGLTVVVARFTVPVKTCSNSPPAGLRSTVMLDPLMRAMTSYHWPCVVVRLAEARTYHCEPSHSRMRTVLGRNSTVARPLVVYRKSVRT